MWDLNFTQLTSLIKAIKKVLKQNDNDDDLSFLVDTTKVDVEMQLRFDIAKDVYLTKKKDAEELRSAADIKEHNQKILGLIARKQENELEGKSVEELEKLLK